MFVKQNMGYLGYLMRKSDILYGKSDWLLWKNMQNSLNYIYKILIIRIWIEYILHDKLYKIRVYVTASRRSELFW